MKTGFTLIELLVVILIIGILSAVALPQYNQAVLKARYSEMQTIIAAYKTAAEAYYMANGEYPKYWNDMDLTPPAGCSASNSSGGRMDCNNKGFDIDLYDNTNINFLGFYRSGNVLQAAYAQWLDVSEHPGQRECWAFDRVSAAHALCRSLGGVQSGKSPSPFCTNSGGCTIYVLP